MKTAQQLYDYIKKNPPAHTHQMAAMQLAYDHTFGKGYNPEVLDELYHTAYLGRQLATAIILKENIPQLLVGYTNEEAKRKIIAILEKAKLK